jgi:hypothetical protein
MTLYRSRTEIGGGGAQRYGLIEKKARDSAGLACGAIGVSFPQDRERPSWELLGRGSDGSAPRARAHMCARTDRGSRCRKNGTEKAGVALAARLVEYVHTPRHAHGFSPLGLDEAFFRSCTTSCR